jgi:D-alanine-D-alanine ligase
MKQRIAILTGGENSEREIALRSAEAVKNALTERFEVLCFNFPKDLDKFFSVRDLISAAIPVFHGRGGEDGVIQGFLRTLKMPFLFSDLEAQAIAADKSLAKLVVTGQGIKTPEAIVVSKGDKVAYTNPVVIKPLDGGSSFGVSIVKDRGFFEQALKIAFEQSSKAIVEDYVKGDEYTVPIIDKDGIATALPVIAIRPKTEFFDTRSKYDPALVDEICPAPISVELAGALKDAAVKIHQAIGARHVSRSDFILDQGGAIWFLEINTIPGMTVNSLLPKALKVAGLDFGKLLGLWIKSIL